VATRHIATQFMSLRCLSSARRRLRQARPSLGAPVDGAEVALPASQRRRRMARGQSAITVPTPAFAPVKRAVPVSGWGVRRGEAACRPPRSRGEGGYKPGTEITQVQMSPIFPVAHRFTESLLRRSPLGKQRSPPERSQG
jgi:hypothetical protein